MLAGQGETILKLNTRRAEVAGLLAAVKAARW
jgi:hypothetical protein